MSDEMERRAREFLKREFHEKGWKDGRFILHGDPTDILTKFAEQVRLDTLEQVVPILQRHLNHDDGMGSVRECLDAAIDDIRALAGGK